MFTAITPAAATMMSENIAAMGGLATPSVARQIEIDWAMAHSLDLAGDKFKAAGKMEVAQVCYSRALARANKALAAQNKLAV